MSYKIGILTNEEGQLFKWQKESVDRIAQHNEIIFLKPIVNISFESSSKEPKFSEKLNWYLLPKTTSFHTTYEVDQDKIKDIFFEKKVGKYYLQHGQEKVIEGFDLIVRFGLNILSGKILTIPKIGVLSFHHGCMEKFKGGPAGFWEILEDEHLTVSTQILNEKLDAGVRIFEAHFANTGDFSRNREVIYKMSPIILEKSLKILREKNLSNLKSLRITSYRVFKHPKLFHISKYWFKKMKLKFSRKLKKVDPFNIYMKITDSDAEDISLSGGLPLFEEKRSNILRADPFLSEINGELITLVYEYLDPKKSEIGHIRKLEYDCKQKVVLNDKVLIQKQHHLSFPFVFQLPTKGNIILPEQRKKLKERNKYEYYDAITGFKIGSINFPYTDLVDIVLFNFRETIFAFATQVIENDISDGVLRLFILDLKKDIANEHSSSPISIGQESSRMAGKIIYKDGKLYRLFQNNLKGYGESIGVSEILELSMNSYKESILQKRIKPKGAKAIHHLDRLNNITVYDRS